MAAEFKVKQIVWNVCSITYRVHKAKIIRSNKIGNTYIYTIKPVNMSYTIYGSNLFLKKSDAIEYATKKINDKISTHKQAIKDLENKIAALKQIKG